MLLFTDSFDHYQTAHLLLKYTTSSVFTISAGNGRNSTASLSTSSNGANQTRFLGGSKSTLIAGFAYKTSALTNNVVFRFQNGGAVQSELRITTAGKLAFYLGGSLLATSNLALITAGVYAHIQLKVNFDHSNPYTQGNFDVRVNGVTITWDSDNTQVQTANTVSTADTIGWAFGGGATIHYDDLWVCDDTGTYNNDWLGDVRVQALFPDGDVSGQSDWTAQGATNDYECVDESTNPFPDGDTTYIHSQTVGQRSIFTFGNLAASIGQIKAVQLVATARKDDAGTRSIAHVIREGTDNYDSATNHDLGDDYDMFPEIYEANPDTSSPWLISEVNAIQAGVKLTA